MVVEGGMGVVTQSFARAAMQAGATIQTGKCRAASLSAGRSWPPCCQQFTQLGHFIPLAIGAALILPAGLAASSVLIEGGAAVGIVTANGRERRARAVLANADPLRLRVLAGAGAFPPEFNAWLDKSVRDGQTLKVCAAACGRSHEHTCQQLFSKHCHHCVPFWRSVITAVALALIHARPPGWRQVNLAMRGLPTYRCLPEDHGQFRTTTHLLPSDGDDALAAVEQVGGGHRLDRSSRRQQRDQYLRTVPGLCVHVRQLCACAQHAWLHPRFASKPAATPYLRRRRPRRRPAGCRSGRPSRCTGTRW